MPRGRRRRRPKKKVTSQPPDPSQQPSSSNVNVVVDEDDGGGVSPPSSPQPTIELYKMLIYKEKLDEASRRCRDFPQDARWKGLKGSLAIHVACDYGVPLSLIRQLHEAYGEGIRTRDDHGFLPLHVACYRSSLEVITYLYYLYPDGATKKDYYGKTPVDILDHSKTLSEEDKATVRGILSNPPDECTPSPRQQPTTTRTPAEISSTTSAAAATTTASRGAPNVIPSNSDEVDVANPAAKPVAADELSEGARSSAEGLEAAEAEAGTAAHAARKVWEDAAKKRAAAKVAARFGRRKAEVSDRNAARLRREAEVARGNVESTAVAASSALTPKREEQYKVFAKDRDTLKLPFFEESMGHRSPSVVLSDTPRPRTPSP